MVAAIKHSAGIVIEGDARECISHALKVSGLDYGIRRERLMTVPREGVPQTLIPNRVSLFRENDNGYLGTVGQDYAVVPNKEVFMPLDALVSSGQYEVDLVGEFGGGRKAFVLLKGQETALIEGGDDDTVGNYLLFSTSHDGHGSLKGCVLPYRFSCSNAIAGAMRSSGILSLIHNATMKDRMQELLSFAKRVPGHFTERCAEFRYLAGIKPTVDAAKFYLEGLDASQKITKSVIGTAEARGKNLKSFWTLYNGYNGYLNHEASKNADSRLSSVLLGQSAKKDTRALEFALEVAA